MKKLIALTLMSFLLAACAGPLGAAPSETPTRSKPSKTPRPTVTFTAAPPPSVSDALNGVVVHDAYGFDGSQASDWPFENSLVSETDGMLVLNGHDWEGVQWAGDIGESQGILINFSYAQGSIFEIYLQSGPWGKKEYRRFGVSIADKTVRTNIWQGTALLIDRRIAGTLVLLPDRWYQLLLVVAPDGSLTAVIGDPTEPGNTLRYADDLGTKWAGLVWNFKVGGQRGIVDFDDFNHLSFTSFK